MVGIIKEFKYDYKVKLWWKPKKGRTEKNLKYLIRDRDSMDMANCKKYKAESRNLCLT